jgi:hypothetical protein
VVINTAAPGPSDRAAAAGLPFDRIPNDI